MRLPNSAHTSRPWRVHDIAHDFRLEDVWALPTPGGPDDFHSVVRLFTSVSLNGSPFIRALVASRWTLGTLFGWDAQEPGAREPAVALRERLPADLKAGPVGPTFDVLPFRPLYLTGDEFAAEIQNRTVHGILHLGWVRDGGTHRGQLAVLVKPKGPLGTTYMAAILPFRRLIVYPAGMRRLGRTWRSRDDREVAL